jgi:hypothetical protein
LASSLSNHRSSKKERADRLGSFSAARYLARDLRRSLAGERAWESASADAHYLSFACHALSADFAVQKIGMHPILL